MIEQIRIGDEVTIKTSSSLSKEIFEKTEWEHYVTSFNEINIMLPFWANVNKNVIGVRENANESWFRIEKKWNNIKAMPQILERDKKE